MKVCITRNDEAYTNASLTRVATAISELTDDVCLLTRSRDTFQNKVVKKEYNVNGKQLDNYELNIKGKPSGGLKNIFQLLKLEIKVFKWFFSNKDKYDIIHAFDLDMGLPTFLISLFTKKKYVYHVADFYVDSRNGLPSIIKPLLRKLEHLVINRAETAIICTDEREEQISGSKPKNISVVHNTPILSSEIERVLENSQEKRDDVPFTLTYVGSLTERRFIKNVVDVISDFPNISLTLAGTGPLTDYVVEKSNQYENITFLGKVDYNESLKLYTKTDAMFAVYNPEIPNHKYSAPNKVYEAMMVGKPIIVAKNTGIDKIVDKNQMGISIDYKESNFRDLIEKISENEIDLKTYGQNARKTYEKYSWQKMKDRIKDIYFNIK